MAASDQPQDIPKVKLVYPRCYELQKTLNEQRKTEKFCDITFHCSGGNVSAHKCVLANAADFFKNLFDSPASSANVLVLDDFSVETMTLLLDIIYSEADIPSEQVIDLLKLAVYVQMDWLVDILEQGLRKTINESTLFQLYKFAKEYKLKTLKFICECFVRENVDKLPQEEVGSCFDSDVLGELKLWDPELSRDVAVIHLTDEKKINLEYWSVPLRCAIDPKTGKYRRLPQTWSSFGNIETTFVYENVFYVVKKEGKETSIWKFQHASKTFDVVFGWTDDELSLNNETNGLEFRSLHPIHQLFYDEKGSLYVKHQLEGWEGNWCIFKLDVGTLKFYDGFLLARGTTAKSQGDWEEFVDCELPHHLILLNDNETHLVCPNRIYNLDKHDFHQSNVWVSDLCGIDLNFNMITKDPGQFTKDRITIGDFGCLGWILWKPFSLNGTFYCVVQADCEIYDYTVNNLVVKLDISTRTWVHLCSLAEFSFGEEEPFAEPFHCNSQLYIYWEDKMVDLDRITKKIFHFDEQEEKLKEVKQMFPWSFDSYVVAPYHVLL